MPPTPNHIDVQSGDVLLLLGTAKGLFLLQSSAARDKWNIGGPYSPGQPIYSLMYDGRGGRHRIFAAGGHPHFGPMLRTSDDFGRHLSEPEKAPVRFPESTATSIKQIWQLTPGHASEPDTLYCGVEPAALFRSPDAGKSWALVEGLWNHPHRPAWQPGGGGLCLHTILPHPEDCNRMTVAISTAGVYHTSDGGTTWEPRNKGVRAVFLPNPMPEFGQCVHKIGFNPQYPDRLYLQNHWGLYRSDDGGRQWNDIARDVPSDFGFPLAVHPRRPDTVYIIPLDSDQFRCTVGGRLRVYRTHDGGDSWHALTAGLPQENAYECVLRDALCTDSADEAGIYFGTRSGKLYGSPDSGDNWSLLSDGLPPVLCVRAAHIN